MGHGLLRQPPAMTLRGQMRPHQVGVAIREPASRPDDVPLDCEEQVDYEVDDVETVPEKQATRQEDEGELDSSASSASEYLPED